MIVTGGRGTIAGEIVPLLPDTWAITSTGRHAEASTPLDITDLDACRAVFQGADAVVHLAAVSEPDSNWEELLPANVIGCYNVARAAADAGVRRLVLAGSVQAVMAYPRGYQVRPGDAPRPKNLYGATKAWAEAVGSWISETSATSAVVLRLGNFETEPPRVPAGQLPGVAEWLSPRDCAGLIRAAVEWPGSGYLVASAVSANRYPHLEITQTAATLGYHPVDDGWSS